MPRHKRLEIPGAIYHVIVRGIERREIFKDDLDRTELLRRFKETQKSINYHCYAWALMPNHFHMLIQTGKKPLSDIMRKLLTGYAIYFNHRHKRSGYLYQNRYKSILCDKDAYLLELVRYIHLNPVRGKLVKDVQQLNEYRWSGHSAIMGTCVNEWQTIDEILVHFGKRQKDAVKNYWSFIKDGESGGKREEFSGGGLRRSAGGWDGLKELRRNNERWLGDERILGNGNFVETVLKLSEEDMIRRERLKRAGWNIDKLIDRACALTGIESDELKKKGRDNNVSQAKGLIVFWAKRELGMKGTEVAKALGITRQAVSLLLANGEKYASRNSVNLTS